MAAVEASDLELLRQTPLFAGLDEETLRAVAGRCRRRRFRADVSLFHEGDPGQSLYVVGSGCLRIETSGSGDQTIHLARRGPGEVVGELSLIDGKPRMADVVTDEPSELLMLDRADFLRLIEESPPMALSIMACLADRLRQAADQLESQQSQDVLGRVSGAILAMVEARGNQEADGWRIATPTSQRQLAEELGTTRESVNRAFSRLKQVQAIRSDGRDLIVLNARKLRQYAGDEALRCTLQPY